MSDDDVNYSELTAIRTFSTHAEADILAVVLRNAGLYAVVPMEQNVLADAEVVFQAGLPVMIRPEDRDRAEAAIAEAKAAGDWMEQNPDRLPGLDTPSSDDDASDGDGGGGE
jgi:hypothetical protein